MRFYRLHFPQTSVLPTGWIEKWGVGLGLMGEQGAESIHTSLNNIERSYLNMITINHNLRMAILELQVSATHLLSHLQFMMFLAHLLSICFVYLLRQHLCNGTFSTAGESTCGRRNSLLDKNLEREVLLQRSRSYL